MNKITVAMMTVFLLIGAPISNAQRNDGVLMDVHEVDIARMRAARMSGAEAVMKVMEQFTDRQYRFAFISDNYLVPAQQQKYLNVKKDKFIIAVAGYPEWNNLVYTHVFYNNSFFFIALTKGETDLKRSSDMQIIRVNYEKGNAVRRNNVRDTIQRNNTIPLGIDIAERR